MSGEANHEIYTRRQGRNFAVAGLLFLMVALIFAVTIVKLRENARSPFFEYNNPAHSNDGMRAPAASEAAQ